MPDCLPSARLNAASLKKNVPVAITVELTRRCPLSCLHCYLPETRGRAWPGAELSTAGWKKVLRGLARAGGLYLVFTGGEPLLRPDLAELCRFAKKLRFDVRVFSSGLGLTPALAEEFSAAGVSAFELSLYGRPGRHDSITGRKGSCAATLAAARLLRAAGVGVKLKVPLLRRNAGEITWIKRLAHKESFMVSFDPIVAPANDGDGAALKYRLAGRGLAAALRSASAGTRGAAAGPEDPSIGDFLCGAGRNVCAVGPDGALLPCLQLPMKLGNLVRSPFSKLWRESPWLKKWRRYGLRDLAACRDCRLLAWCSRCPGISMLESGDPLAPNDAACALAAARAGRERVS